MKKINNAQTTKTLAIQKNLMFQVDSMLKHASEKSKNTRHRYYEAAKRICTFLAEHYQLQKFQNVDKNHIIHYSEYLKGQGYSVAYIKTDLSGIRFFTEKSGNRNPLPKNEELALGKPQVGLQRAWTAQEIETAIALACWMGRIDVAYAISMVYIFGMRLAEVCRCQVNQLRDALEGGQLLIIGRNGQKHYLHLTTEEQIKLVRELLVYASKQKKDGADKLLIDSFNGSVVKTKRSIEYWIGNHRSKFEDKSGETPDEHIPAAELTNTYGVKSQIRNISAHGLRHSFCINRYQYYRQQGYDDMHAKISVSEDLGLHGSEVTMVHLAGLK